MYNRRNSQGKNIFIAISLLVSFFIAKNSSATEIPKPDHVVVCMLENHSYQQIIGSVHAPYINTLVFQSANMQEYYALTHPSQPNYLMLFSGSNQSETTDNLPASTPWTTPNLGGSLINSGYSFVAYSEGLPTPGSTVAVSGAYARKHCPWVNWQGTGLNQIPASSNLSMDDFPTDFSQLPDVSFVIPDQTNDMHNGSDPGRIVTGDTWLQDHLKPYVDWAMDNNSLFILTFDEDNFTPNNHIVCLFIGPMVRQGNYYLRAYDHYDLLRTIEDMYALPHAGNSANGHPIDEIWMTSLSIQDISTSSFTASVYPNPVTDNSVIVLESDPSNKEGEIHLLIYDITGRVVHDETFHFVSGTNKYAFRKEGLTDGIYTFLIRNEKRMLASGKVIVD